VEKNVCVYRTPGTFTLNGSTFGEKLNDGQQLGTAAFFLEIAGRRAIRG